jgi:predicted metal-dependent enzyme (double-stranded beta helix superfamily)
LQYDLGVHPTITAPDQRILTPQQLAAEVRRLTARPAEWVARVRLDPEGRWYEQIHMGDAYELWLISWLPGQSTGFHDHGGANGAFGVVWGQLDEYRVTRGTGDARPAGLPGATRPAGSPATARPVTAGTVRSFGPRHVHDVRNAETGSVAVSVHAYSPPLSAMTRYDLTPGGLVPVRTEGSDDW